MIFSFARDEFFNILYHSFPLDLFDLFYLDGEKIDSLSILSTNLIELIESSTGKFAEMRLALLEGDDSVLSDTVF